MRASPLLRPVFGPTPRLIAYCVLVGVIGGVVAFGFEELVKLAQHLLLEGVGGYTPPTAGELVPESEIPTGRARLWLPIVTTLGGLLSGFLVYRFAPETEGHGTDAAIDAYHRRGGDIRPRVPLIKAVTSALTIGSGGVAGKEGPTAQISVGLATMIAKRTRLRGQARRHLLLAGMAAGLAAMFRAPLGMAIFSVEILYAGMAFEAEALIYTVIAAVTAYATFGVLSGWERLFAVPAGLELQSPAVLPAFILLGLLAGVVGALLPWMLERTRLFFRRLPVWPHVKPAIGGLILGLVAIADPRILGTGYGWMEMAMVEALPLSALLLILLTKGPGMALTIGSGGSGGVFAPTVAIGGLLGALTGSLLHGVGIAESMPVAGFVVVGMAAVFAGAARTPISTLIMVAEMTGGYGLIVPAMLANVVAFLTQRGMTRDWPHPTLYPSQVESPADSPLHRGVFVRRAMELVEAGEVDAADVQLPRLVSLLSYGEPIRVSRESGLLVTLEIEPRSELDGGSVASEIGSVSGATAVAVLRAEEMLIPRGDTELRAGDQLLLVATPEAWKLLQERASAVVAADGSPTGPLPS
jgi:CIC family chloride channel protein